MNIKFTKGLSKEEKLEMEQDYLNAERLREKITEILETDKNNLVNKLLSNESFEKPAYSENQAHLLGRIKQLTEFINLIK